MIMRLTQLYTFITVITLLRLKRRKCAMLVVIKPEHALRMCARGELFCMFSHVQLIAHRRRKRSIVHAKREVPISVVI